MPILREKSFENFQSANILVQNKKHCASIHCFYYSCFQLSKHLLKNSCGIDYKDQVKNAKDLNQGSHNYIIYALSDDIEQISNSDDKIEYLEHINKLKSYRERADYDQERIGARFSQKTESECAIVFTLLKKVYNIDEY